MVNSRLEPRHSSPRCQTVQRCTSACRSGGERGWWVYPGCVGVPWWVVCTRAPWWVVCTRAPWWVYTFPAPVGISLSCPGGYIRLPAMLGMYASLPCWVCASLPYVHRLGRMCTVFGRIWENRGLLWVRNRRNNGENNGNNSGITVITAQNPL